MNGPARLDASHRLDLLHRASALASDPSDDGDLLRRIASLPLPALGDWSVLALVDRDEEVGQVVAAHDDPARAGLAARLEDGPPPGGRLGRGLARALDVREPTRLETVRDDAGDLAALGDGPALAVPLLWRGELIGALALVRAADRPPYDADEVDLARLLAGLVAPAVQSLRLGAELAGLRRARDELLSAISHDLKNPLTAVQVNAEVLLLAVARAPSPQSERLTNGLSNIRLAAERIGTMIDAILDTAPDRARRATRS